MSDIAVTRTVARAELDANAVLTQAWRLYKRLFTRSILMGGVIFGLLHLLEAFARSGRSSSALGLLTVVLAVTGIALLQGGLVEIVRGLHVDGNDDASAMEALGRAGGKVVKLVRVSFLSGLGIGLGFMLFLVPGFVLMTRWAVAVPVAMLEGGNARDALRRSRAIVDGNGWNVFKVLFAVGALSVAVAIPLSIATSGHGLLGWWVSSTLAAMLTAPYSAHALTVVYYALREPDRPVILDAGQRWQSVWNKQDAPEDAPEGPPPTRSILDEYEQRFDERNKQWDR